ncbi:MAG: ATP-dependent Clp protease adaptor ClpS [Planctomycetia bacterium]|nr:ATP-dependent Clp protease adaptor ClpS [Planctomycetia bacterium]
MSGLDDFDTAMATIEPEVEKEAQTNQKPKRQPRYNVILWNDEYHTYDYVIAMLTELFGFTPEQGFQSAEVVDQEGRCVVLTTTLEHAELKRDQIHAYGRDPRLRESRGSMWATIEPLPADGD